MEAIPWWHDTARTLARYLPVLALIVWCLWAVNWRKAWPVLAAGGWVALVLIAVMGAVVWSLVFPVPLGVAGVLVPNGLWQTAAVTLLVGIVLACGWLQTWLGAHPPELSFEPQPA